jgi:hypothetical protein
LETNVKYLPRPRAAEFLRDSVGISISAQGLADRAHEGTGPRYSIINGRAVYTESDLVEWVAQQAARPVVRRSQRKSAQVAA